MRIKQQEGLTITLMITIKIELTLTVITRDFDEISLLLTLTVITRDFDEILLTEIGIIKIEAFRETMKILQPTTNFFKIQTLRK